MSKLYVNSKMLLNSKNKYFSHSTAYHIRFEEGNIDEERRKIKT